MSAIDAYAGESPARIIWNVVRGDDTGVAITLLNNDGTPMTTTGWTYASKASYNGEVFTLTVTPDNNIITIAATSEMTALWGAGNTTNPAAQLPFDLQVIKDDHSKWTPVIGRIVVFPDVT